MKNINSWIDYIIKDVEKKESRANEERMFDENYEYGGGHYYDKKIEDEENGEIYYD